MLAEISTEDYYLVQQRPLTASAYVAGAQFRAFASHFAAGDDVPPMPLFLTGENYINVPVEEAYRTAWEDVPPQYQQILAAPSPENRS